MKKLLVLMTFTTLFGTMVSSIVGADPLSVINNSFTQNRVGLSQSSQSLNTIVGSTIANGSAGNTFTVSEAKSGDGFANFNGNKILQQSIGDAIANQSATLVVNSSIANNAAGNAMTFSGQ